MSVIMRTSAITEDQARPLLDEEDDVASISSTSAVGSEPKIEITSSFKVVLIIFIATAIVSEIGYASFMGEVDKSSIAAVTHLEHIGIDIITPFLGAFAALAALVPILSLERSGENLLYVYQRFKNPDLEWDTKMAFFVMCAVCQVSFLFEGFGATAGYLKKGWGRSIEWFIIAFSVLAQFLRANMNGGGKIAVETVESFQGRWLGWEKLFNRHTILQWGLLVFSSACQAMMSGYNVSEVSEFIPFFKAPLWNWIAGATAFFRMAVTVCYPALKRSIMQEEQAVRPLALQKPKNASDKIGLFIASINFLAQVIGDYTFAQAITRVLNCDEWLVYLSWGSVVIGIPHHWQEAVLNATDNAEGLAYVDDHLIQPYCCCRRAAH